MTPRLLKGTNASYFFFPNEASTLISKSETSIVYLAAELDTKEKFICKQFLPNQFINATARLKFIIEASLSLRHPGIVKTIDLIIEGTDIFIIQEYVQGHTLKDLINNRQFYDYKNNYFFYRIIASILDTLKYLHGNKLCHCDLQPSNIIIRDIDGNLNVNNPETVIVDLASLKPSFNHAVLDAGAKTFNIMYGSPEQIFGFNELVGEHSDIFTLGLILYEAIAKEPALNTSNPMFIKRIQSTVRIESHYRFDDELFYVISKACIKPRLHKSAGEYSADEIKILIAKALSLRYQSAMEFKDDLMELIN